MAAQDYPNRTETRTDGILRAWTPYPTDWQAGEGFESTIAHKRVEGRRLTGLYLLVQDGKPTMQYDADRDTVEVIS